MAQAAHIAYTHRLLPAVAAFSIYAGVLHGGVTGAHFQAWFWYGMFFFTSAILQGVFGAFLFLRLLEVREALRDPIPRPGMLRPSALERPFYWAGIWGNAATVVLYLVTRTVGIPFFGPEAGRVEGWDLYGLLTTFGELMVVVLLLAVLRSLAPGSLPMPMAGER